jgi:hypothetical protein
MKGCIFLCQHLYEARHGLLWQQAQTGTCFSWLSTRLTAPGSFDTTVNAPWRCTGKRRPAAICRNRRADRIARFASSPGDLGSNRCQEGGAITTRSPYRPMFFAYDCASSSSMPASANCRTAAASRSRSPLAKPYGRMDSCVYQFPSSCTAKFWSNGSHKAPLHMH